MVAHGACIAGTSVPVAHFACLGVKGKAAHIVQQICFELAVLGYPAVVILREIHLLEKLVKGFVGADDIRLGERYVFGMVNAYSVVCNLNAVCETVENKSSFVLEFFYNVLFVFLGVPDLSIAYFF